MLLGARLVEGTKGAVRPRKRNERIIVAPFLERQSGSHSTAIIGTATPVRKEKHGSSRVAGGPDDSPVRVSSGRGAGSAAGRDPMYGRCS